MINKSKTLINANDSIRRTVGIDIRKAIGGKTAAEIAEERLHTEVKAKTSTTYNGIGGYQGVVIPLDKEEIRSTPQQFEVKNPGGSHTGNMHWKPDTN